MSSASTFSTSFSISSGRLQKKSMPVLSSSVLMFTIYLPSLSPFQMPCSREGTSSRKHCICVCYFPYQTLFQYCYKEILWYWDVTCCCSIDRLSSVDIFNNVSGLSIVPPLQQIEYPCHFYRTGFFLKASSILNHVPFG